MPGLLGRIATHGCWLPEAERGRTRVPVLALSATNFGTRLAPRLPSCASSSDSDPSRKKGNMSAARVHCSAIQSPYLQTFLGSPETNE